MNDTISVTKPALEQLPESLRFIAQTLQSETDLSIARIKKVVKEANVQPKDLQPWTDFDHPVTDSYGRKMVFKADNFEIMVMSWRPGDFSAIHDHGHTQWGAVQIFGPAEHATFRFEDGFISTLARWIVKPRDIVGVSHNLVHQMGNPTEDTFMLSLHVYGLSEKIDNVTGDARIFDLRNNTIQRVDGGVFFALPPGKINKTETGPVADFPTRLRHMVELARRVQKIGNAGITLEHENLEEILKETFSPDHHQQLLKCLRKNTDENNHQNNSIYWKTLNKELKEAAQLQRTLKGEAKGKDHFHKYAELYDQLIGQPCLDSFMAKYLSVFKENFEPELNNKKIISLGCGTGLIEAYLIKEMEVPYENIYGIDISEAMVLEARNRIRADEGNILELDPGIMMWDIAFSGLNVYQYLNHRRLEEAIQKTAVILKPGGYFIGDFITPDHIRWYPNVMYSKDRQIISLRTPRLIEVDGAMFQESEIINIRFDEAGMMINYAGKHKRFLPPINRVRNYFEKAFGGNVVLLDALSLKPIPEWADSCASTRYVVIAEKR